VFVYVAVQAAVEAWEALKAKGLLEDKDVDYDIYTQHQETAEVCTPAALPVNASALIRFAQDLDADDVISKPDSYVAHVAVPSQVDIEKLLVQRQRKVRCCPSQLTRAHLLLLFPTNSNVFLFVNCSFCCPSI
jgi:hypothetical protein